VSGSQGGPAGDQWFRGVVEQLVAGIVAVQDGRIAYANPQAAQIFGREPADLIGREFTSLLEPSQRERHVEATRMLLAGECERTCNTYDIVMPSGATRHIEKDSARIDIDGRPALLGVMHDIAEQRRAAEALREGEERFRSTVETLDEGVMTIDTEGRVVGANRAAEHLMRADLETMRRLHFADRELVGLDGTPVERDRLPLQRALLTGKPQRHAILGHRWPDGSIAWFDINVELRHDEAGAIAGAIVTFSDVTEQRRLADALRQSESTHRTLMDSLADGVFMAQDGRFVYSNATLPRQLGFEPHEFIGVPCDRVVAPAARPTWDAALAAGADQGGGIEGREVRLLRRDGGGIDFELVANRTRFLGRPAVLGVLRDITERKAAAAELDRHRHHLEELVHERTRALEQAVAARIASEHFAQTMTDNQPTLLAYLDAELRLQFANRAYLAWFGKTREEAIGRDGREVVGEVLARPSAEYSARVLAGEAFATTSEMRGADGRVGHFWIYRLPDVHDGRIRGYYFIATDITELRRSERRLEEANAALVQAEQFTRDIADNLPGRIAYWDRDVRCRFANRVFCEWFGIPREEALGCTMAEIFRRPIDAANRQRIGGALAGEPQRFEREEVSASGQRAISLVHYVPDRVDGEVRGFYVLTADITPLKQAQADLQTLNAELVTARDRAESAAGAKAVFLANMSHEIRTPMNVIIGLTHLMQRDRHDRATAERLAKVGEAAQHLLDIINDILDLSKVEAGRLPLTPTDFSVDALLARSKSFVAEAARRKGLALSVDRGDLPEMLHGDALRLSQVLVNLLGNAVKFTARGSIDLRCDVLSREGDRWTVRFAVRDTGIGIAPARIEQLFKPFEQADASTTRRYGGTGLGLSIARELAQLMGGRVGVESAPGRGSLFWFTAVLASAAPSAVRTDAALRAAEGGDSIERVLRERHGGANVLLVDDNLVNQELATELLRIVDLRSDVAGDGRRAVEMASQGRYDLILMDMQMPEMDGLEATRVLRAMPGLDRTPIIAMTASAFGADRAACIAAGMNDHLGKPVHPAVLYDTLLRWLDESRAEIARAATSNPGQEGHIPGEVHGHPRRLEDELARVPGLDVERGLCFFAGRHASYVKALRHFAGLFPEGLAAVGDFLARHPGATREAVRREVHSFGGASAALGALDAERSARRIDALLREKPSAAETADEPGLRAELEAIHAQAATLLARLRQALGPAPELRASLESASPDRPEPR